MCNANYPDIDECAEGVDGCAQTCTNVISSYLCSCSSGYRLESNNHGCQGKFHCNTIPNNHRGYHNFFLNISLILTQYETLKSIKQ